MNLPEREKTEFKKLSELDATDFSIEIRIKLETMKQLKRIADRLDSWNNYERDCLEITKVDV